jgi:hypothetical protein
MNNTPTLSELGFTHEDDAARILDVKVPTLRNWRSARRGPPFVRLNGRTVVYPLADLRAWIEARAVRPDREPSGTLANPRLRSRAARTTGAGA